MKGEKEIYMQLPSLFVCLFSILIPVLVTSFKSVVYCQLSRTMEVIKKIDPKIFFEALCYGML